MNNDCQLFQFGEEPVRVVLQSGQSWFVAVDVCRVLELTNPTMVLEQLEADERAKFYLGRQGETNIINESGLYALIFKSRKAKAKEFRKWVTSEVLPAIRRTGRYDLRAARQSEADEVRDLVLATLRAVAAGTADPDRAQAIFTGAKIWKLLDQGRKQAFPIEGDVPEAEAGDLHQWGVLVEAMAQGDVSRLWTAGELRGLSIKLGCFAGWLTPATSATPAVRSRFGKLCVQMAGREFDGFRFVSQGHNRDRTYGLQRVFPALPGAPGDVIPT